MFASSTRFCPLPAIPLAVPNLESSCPGRTPLFLGQRRQQRLGRWDESLFAAYSVESKWVGASMTIWSFNVLKITESIAQFT